MPIPTLKRHDVGRSPSEIDAGHDSGDPTVARHLMALPTMVELCRAKFSFPDMIPGMVIK